MRKLTTVTVVVGTLALGITGCAEAGSVEAVTTTGVQISVPTHSMAVCSEEDASGPVGSPCVWHAGDEGVSLLYVGEAGEVAHITNAEAEKLARS